MNSLLSYFSQVPTLAALPEDVLKRLERTAEQRNYRRRQVIHFADQPGDYLYVLCSGRVKISRVSDQGREVTLYLLDAVSLFGETGLADQPQAYGLMAETLEESLVATVRRADLREALEASPSAAMALLRLMAERRGLAETKIADLVFLEVPKRLAKLLLRLSESGDPANGLLAAKYTHQELANMIGSTRETTTLVLNDFKRREAIEFHGRRIAIQDRTRLETLLQGESLD